jgi:hypothetical protein
MSLPASRILSTLRRLYHHLNNGGTWSDLDTYKLSLAISTIEELSEGECRFNCRTAQANWREGYESALIDGDHRPLPVSSLEERSEKAWKEYKDES